MSNIVYLKNKVTSDTKQIEKGFNWKVFLFGWVYLFIVGDYLKGVVLLIVDTVLGYMATTFDNGEILPMTLILLILAINAFTAWDFHKDYIKILEKKDYNIIDTDNPVD